MWPHIICTHNYTDKTYQRGGEALLKSAAPPNHAEGGGRGHLLELGHRCRGGRRVS
jgi:hypothetical protein